MNRDYRLKVSLSKRIENVSIHTSFIDKDGNPLSRENTKTAQRLLECWYRLCVDVLFSVTTVAVTADVCSSWLSSQPATLSISTWISSLEEMTDLCIHGRGLNLEASNDVTSWLKRFFRSKYIRFMSPRREVFQLLRFPKRLTLLDVEELKAATEDAFFNNVTRVEKLNTELNFTTSESTYIQGWLADYESPVLEDCYHSGGSTADPQVRNRIREKYAFMTEDPYTWEFCKHARIPICKIPTGTWFSNYYAEMLRMRIRVKPDYSDYIPSRVQFVPKSYKTYRSVAMESETRMFYQNGVLSKLRKCIRQHLSSNIDLMDQDRSKRLALEASRSKEYATIDFSMASDSVSLGLFSLWFGNTKFGQDALLLRARSFEYEGKEFGNPIAFTMGSPLCFPVECLVFLAMAYATIEQAGGDPFKEKVYVYGDDVILPAKYAEAYMARAVSNGFLPNADKSYWQEDIEFREACGMEAYGGEDITPIYIPRGFTGSLEKSYSSYVHLANAAYGRGYFGLRKKVLFWLTSDKVRMRTQNRLRRDQRKAARVRSITSFVTYSSNLQVLTDESSTLVFDPRAEELNKPLIRFRRRPYASNVPFTQKVKYIKVLSATTLTDKSKTGMTDRARQKAKLSFCLHYKPKHVMERYGRIDPVVAKLLDEPFIFEPEPDRGLEPTVTRLAVTIRPIETID